MGGQLALQVYRYGLAPRMGNRGVPSQVEEFRRRTLSEMKEFHGQEVYPISQVLKQNLWLHKASPSLEVEHVIPRSRQFIS